MDTMAWFEVRIKFAGFWPNLLSLRTHLDHFLDSVGVCCFQPV